MPWYNFTFLFCFTILIFSPYLHLSLSQCFRSSLLSLYIYVIPIFPSQIFFLYFAVPLYNVTLFILSVFLIFGKICSLSLSISLLEGNAHSAIRLYYSAYLTQFCASVLVMRSRKEPGILTLKTWELLTEQAVYVRLVWWAVSMAIYGMEKLQWIGK
jgi:hypothetical protein